VAPTKSIENDRKSKNQRELGIWALGEKNLDFPIGNVQVAAEVCRDVTTLRVSDELLLV
jgi:hypothetical protein